MKIIKNNVLPLHGFSGINPFGVLFVRKGTQVTEKMLNHERIHTEQMKEMAYVFFYLWYAIEWIVRFIKVKNAHTAYRNISFEAEAYQNEANTAYLDHRKHYVWTNYL